MKAVWYHAACCHVIWIMLSDQDPAYLPAPWSARLVDCQSSVQCVCLYFCIMIPGYGSLTPYISLSPITALSWFSSASWCSIETIVIEALSILTVRLCIWVFLKRFFFFSICFVWDKLNQGAISTIIFEFYRLCFSIPVKNVETRVLFVVHCLPHTIHSTAHKITLMDMTDLHISNFEFALRESNPSLQCVLSLEEGAASECSTKLRLGKKN